MDNKAIEREFAEIAGSLEGTFKFWDCTKCGHRNETSEIGAIRCEKCGQLHWRQAPLYQPIHIKENRFGAKAAKTYYVTDVKGNDCKCPCCGTVINTLGKAFRFKCPKCDIHLFHPISKEQQEFERWKLSKEEGA